VLAAAFPNVVLGVSLTFGLTVLSGAYALGPISGGLAGGFAANGYAEHSPGGYTMMAGLVTEVVMTCMFLIVILGATHKRAPVGFAGLAIGLAFTLIHLISIPVTSTSVNPARSTGQALFVGGWAVQQLWLFWIAPLLGAAAGGFVYKALLEGPAEARPLRPIASVQARPPVVAIGRASGRLACSAERSVAVNDQVHEEENAMSVAKVSEISATSSKSFEDAIQQGLARASKTLRNIRGAWIKEQHVRCDNGRIAEYQVNMMVTFVLDD
jgi:aquaporin Z